MKKSSLYLDDELDRALTQAAAKRRITKAEFIRRTLAAAVKDEVAPRFTAIGVVKDTPADLASNDETYLRETGFGER